MSNDLNWQVNSKSLEMSAIPIEVWLPVIAVSIVALLIKIIRGIVLFPLPTRQKLSAKVKMLRKNETVKKTVHALSSAQVGLVLSGGGGKGAYQIGCLRALHHLRITNFAAISGTSVGALNAALIGQGDLREAKDIWSQIKFSDVLKAHPILFFVAAMLRLLLTPMLLIYTSRSLIEARSMYGNLRLKGRTVLFATLTTASQVLIPVPVAGIAASLAANTALHPTDRLIMLKTFGLMISVVLAALCVVWFWWLLEPLHNKLADTLALSSNEPLQDLLRTKLKPNILRNTRIPIFVTMAYLGWVQRRALSPNLKPIGGMSSYADTHPHMHLGYIPVYQRLDSLPDDEMVDSVLQSAALPEVFPRKVISGKRVVDGGAADNTPILPIACTPKIGKRIVIYLQKLDCTLSQQVQREKEQLRKTAELARLEGKLISNYFRTILIAPSVSLGGMFTGTMNFTASKARRAMWLGYWDTLLAIEQGEFTLSVSSVQGEQGSGPMRTLPD